ncbi:hypothetical protein GCM10027168_31640 [Streptomyces capparidis]
MAVKEYAEEQLAAQPIGYWSGVVQRSVVGALRAALAVEGLTQPHWWTLNHVAGSPGTWTRERLTGKLARYDDLGIDFDGVYDDLAGRGWLREDGGVLTLTEEGEAGRQRARERNQRVHERTHEGITAGEYAAALDVLRRMVDNLGGDSDLPE